MLTPPIVSTYEPPHVLPMGNALSSPLLTIRNQSCPNALCMEYGKATRKVGIHSQKDLRLVCLTCKKTWVSHKNTFYYHMKTHPSKIQEAFNLAGQGYSVRKIAGSIHVTPSTVQRWKGLFRSLEAKPVSYTTQVIYE